MSSTSVAAQAQASKTSTSDVKGKGKQGVADGKPSKPRHKLPKGAVLGQKFEEDVGTGGKTVHALNTNER